jgi:hypothetical protein
MYSASPEADFVQGDVLLGVTRKVFDGLRKEPKRGLHPETQWILSWKEQSMTVAIVSQSCDVSLKSKEKRERYVVTPLRRADAGIIGQIEEKLGTLEALNRKPKPGSAEYLNLFYYAPHERLDGQKLLADFTSVFAVRREDVRLDMKALQLTDEQRHAFREKVGYLFARIEDPPSEEEAAGTPPSSGGPLT